MLDYDKWQEIIGTIRKNPLRTILTMFGVFWGIFMLMILMGSGNGLENGVRDEFSGWALNGGWVWSNRTTMPYEGFQPGRFIRFVNSDKDAILKQVEGIEYLAPRIELQNWSAGNNITYNNKSGSFRVYGDYPEYQKIQILDMIAGRHINQKDIDDNRKIAVIGRKVQEVLFEEDEDPLGKYIRINDIYFKVVGIFASKRNQSQKAERDEQSIFTPFTTFQKAYNFGDRIGYFGYASKPGYRSPDVEKTIKEVLMKKHHIHPEDVNALGTENLEEDFGRIQGLFDGIDTFVWIVGIGTLLAGVIGVSNIMLIIVKERTKEIGIRKSLGATPNSIIGLIIQESIFITLIAGFIGLVFGNAILMTISYLIEINGGSLGMFKNPEINLQTALMSLFILMVCGALAGLIPATKASRINPIEALHAE
jgi:putative ABC transport system permease protein